jgi:hypothetical protein
MQSRFHWKHPAKERFGVLCGAEKSQEWMLPWWWARYCEHNTFPVTFFDFGMTEEMKSWCAERGKVCSVELDPFCIAPRSDIRKELVTYWEELYGWTVWNSRRTWFKKPFAFLNSSYKTGVWIDLDCEVLDSLESLFSCLTPGSQLALAREYFTDHLLRFDPNVRYNGGVVVFEHGSSLIEKWAECGITQNHLFCGDDQLLSHLIFLQRLDVVELKDIYNWRMARGLNLNAAIVHWTGEGGKAYIRTHGGLKPSLDTFYHSLKSRF